MLISPYTKILDGRNFFKITWQEFIASVFYSNLSRYHEL